MNVRRLSNGKLVMTAADVSVAIGYSGNVPVLHEMSDRAKAPLKIIDDPEHGFVVELEQAEKYIAKVSAYIAEHHDAWHAYTLYCEQKKREAMEKRRKEAEEERCRAREHARAMAQVWDEKAARKAEEEIAARNRIAAAKAGNPMPFDQFTKKNRLKEPA